MPSRREFLAAAASLPLPAVPRFDAKAWRTRWIHPPAGESAGYGVYLFRKSFNLESPPASLMVRVSADSRYELRVNGVKLCWGPARGTLDWLHYETVDIAPHLRPGANVIAATVWNDGPYAALSQFSHETAFLLEAESSGFDQINAGPDWRCLRDAAYEAIPVPQRSQYGYFAIGPCEKFDAAKHPWGWEQPGFDDSAWLPVRMGYLAAGRGQRDAQTRWALVPRELPPMEETPVRLAKVRRAEGVKPPEDFPAKPAAWTVPANSKAILLLDHGHLATGFPVLSIDGGQGARVSLRYSEGLFQSEKPRRVKGNRNEVEGKTFWGYGDVVVADGRPRQWRPLYWRTWRYIELAVETGAAPLTINDVSAVYTGYPFSLKARFESTSPEHAQIFETGWRTARLCAHETYMDCPYYEQLQYAGDTRIQCLVTLFNSGDPRLVRAAIRLLERSRTPDGITLSRSPSTLPQFIPPFSLWWICMVHDYWWYVPDPDFVREMLPGVRSVLGFYQQFIGDDGLLASMPYWNYVDWVPAWRNGTPPSSEDRMSATIHMQLLLALQAAADLEAATGDGTRAAEYRVLALRLAVNIRSRFWKSGRRMFSEDLEGNRFSQHANVLAVLAGLVEDAAASKDLMERTSSAPPSELDPCSVYFRFYLDRAMAKAGLGDRYLERLGTWQFMLSEGLTTWAEIDRPETRSDCHAWGASPNIEFLRTVLGVDSAAPGFSKVSIRPHLGPFKRLAGAVPHPKGIISVEIERTATAYAIKHSAPPGVEIVL
ncbi:MAG: alpha-L-rhamnosidase N-terminal domain-containing protein [Bryobacteraceae bacterium]|nr:alpha-L-rhamnosidase N-terminal domain-containing protein [Bryobacteraceae bacterium]